jgi:hypothetical protein
MQSNTTVQYINITLTKLLQTSNEWSHTLQANFTQNCNNLSTEYKEWLKSKDFNSFYRV